MRVRAASPEEDEAVAALLYETAFVMYDFYAGGRERAVKVLRAAYARPGNSASAEIVTVAELDGTIAGALAAFPVPEADARSGRFMRLTLARTPPWLWPRALRVYRLGARLTPPAPHDALYVDALATAAAQRRRGVATALLRAAEDQARERGLNAIALDTAERNTGAQAFYEAFGMERSGSSPAIGDMPGAIAYLKRL
jgi:ribosomal protein S18 acetylase RimI-like enzyme